MKNYSYVFIICVLSSFMLVAMKTSAQQNTKNKLRENGAVVFELPEMDNVIIKKDIPYHNVSGTPLKMDIYYPPKFDFQRKIPAIIIVLGYTDMAGQKLLGSQFKNYITFVSWCKIISASGMAAIVYETVNPKKDILSLANYLKSNEDKLGIDNDRIGAFTLSAHTPTAINEVLTGLDNIFQCAAVYYGFFLTKDFKYLPQIDSISKNMGFMTPRLPDPITWKKDIPVMIIRAGKDNVPYINQSLENFYGKAINQNLPITLINYPDASHGFDVLDDNEITRQIINNTIEFWKFYLK